MHGPVIVQIKILKATYGGADVSQKLQSLITVSGLAQTLTVTANNETFGDPTPGRLKLLSVMFKQQSSPAQAKTVKEGETLHIGMDDFNNRSIDIRQVVKALAPDIRLHSQDPHRPVAVEDFLARCQVVRGKGTVSSGGMDLPSTMSVVSSGAVTTSNLASFSRGTHLGGGRNEDISLFPKPGMIGRGTTNWLNPALINGYFSNIGVAFPNDPHNLPDFPDPHFYDDQLETLIGQPIDYKGKATAPMYVRIATREDYFLISYFGFFAYNGGIGLATSYSDRPLAGGNWEAHVGDWIRLTAKVRIVNDLVSLVSIDYEAHGDQNVVTKGCYDNKPIQDVSPIVAYAAWHSHELYPDNGVSGVHLRPGVVFTANDHTDDGPLWHTSANLVFISDDGPDWIFYNGLWGAYITVPGIPVSLLGNGPEGPSFHWYWNNETKDVASPIRQWRDDGSLLTLATPDVKGPDGYSLRSGGGNLFIHWAPVPGATKYVVNVLHYNSSNGPSSFSNLRFLTTTDTSITVRNEASPQADMSVEVTAYDDHTLSSLTGLYTVYNTR